MISNENDEMDIEDLDPEQAAMAREGNPKACIRMFCSQCCGGDVVFAYSCQQTDCWLWAAIPQRVARAAPKVCSCKNCTE